jgi:hypothetical protein
MAQRIEIAYGPPGVAGVRHLMAVGDADMADGAAEAAMRRGAWLAGGVWLVGLLVGSPWLRAAGVGGAAALVLAKTAARR